MGRAIAVDTSGNTYSVGTFLSESIAIATSPVTTLTKVGTGDNLFVVKRSPTGVPLWAKRCVIYGCFGVKALAPCVHQPCRAKEGSLNFTCLVYYIASAGQEACRLLARVLALQSILPGTATSLDLSLGPLVPPSPSTP